MSSGGEELKPTEALETIYRSVSEVLHAARETALRAVDSAMVQAYGQIELEQRLIDAAPAEAE
jgi:hypothetical protein